MQRAWVNGVYIAYFLLYVVAVALIVSDFVSAAAAIVLATIGSHYAIATYVVFADTPTTAYEERYGKLPVRAAVLCLVDTVAGVTTVVLSSLALAGDDGKGITDPAAVAVALATATNVYCVYVHTYSARKGDPVFLN